MKTDRERMLAEEPYDAMAPELVAARRQAKRLCRELGEADGDDTATAAILRRLIGTLGHGVVVEPPLHCDYGSNVRLGDRAYLNVGCVLLDCAPITIGARTLLGPGVHLYTATHPIDAETRARGIESAHAIRIGDDVWIGGGTIVLPGVSIGDRAVIGAGSVVTRSIPPAVIAYGNPCRVQRPV